MKTGCWLMKRLMFLTGSESLWGLLSQTSSVFAFGTQLMSQMKSESAMSLMCELTIAIAMNS